jgi:hypothetical protein
MLESSDPHDEAALNKIASNVKSDEEMDILVKKDSK